MLNLFNGQQNRAAYDQGLATEHAVPILLSWRSIGLPRYADCNNDDDERGSAPAYREQRSHWPFDAVFLVVREELRSFAIAM